MTTALREINARPNDSPARCPRCPEQRNATVYLLNDARWVRTPSCDPCASAYIGHYGAEGVALEPLAGVAYVTAIGGITLADLAREACDGLVGDVDLAKMRIVPSAQSEVARVLSEKLRRSLTPSELVAVHAATGVAVRRAAAEKREGLADIQSRLHRPLFAIGGR